MRRSVVVMNFLTWPEVPRSERVYTQIIDDVTSRRITGPESNHGRQSPMDMRELLGVPYTTCWPSHKKSCVVVVVRTGGPEIDHHGPRISYSTPQYVCRDQS